MSTNPARKDAATTPLQWGELPALHERIAAYCERVRGGDVAIGRTPGPGDIELWSNDYLSLSDHTAIIAAQTAALESGCGDLYMSAVFLNDTSQQRAFERQIAAFVHAEAAVLCQSGWCANAGLVQALADPTTPVYVDQYATPSFWEGARAADAPIHPFRHNRPDRLEKAIKRHGPGIILVDAIYAIDGSICPLDEIVEIAHANASVIVADESHTIGIYGPHGEGLVPALGITDKVQYRTFSLSKAFVTRAGMVVGPQSTMSYFPYEARPAIFSSAVLPYEIAGLVAALNVIQEEDWRRQQLWYNARHLRRGLRRIGCTLGDSHSHVIALDAGSEQDAVALRDALEAEGVFGAVLCAPATAPGRGILRLSANAALSEADLDRVVSTVDRVLHMDVFAAIRERLVRPPAAPAVRARPIPAVPTTTDLRNIASTMRAAFARWNGGR